MQNRRWNGGREGLRGGRGTSDRRGRAPKHHARCVVVAMVLMGCRIDPGPRAVWIEVLVRVEPHQTHVETDIQNGRDRPQGGGPWASFGDDSQVRFPRQGPEPESVSMSIGYAIHDRHPIHTSRTNPATGPRDSTKCRQAPADENDKLLSINKQVWPRRFQGVPPQHDRSIGQELEEVGSGC